MRDSELADIIGDVVRDRVPTAGPHCGAAVLASLRIRGLHVIRGTHTVVDSGWLADVLVQLNKPVRRDHTAGQKAAMYDALVRVLDSKGRGRG